MPREQMKERLVLRAKMIRTDCKQVFADADAWNRLHPDQEPINPDPSGELKAMIAEMDRFIGREVTA